MDNQLNIVDVSDLAGLRREPYSRVADGPGAERPTGGGGTPGFLAILLQGLEDQAPPSSPVPQEEGSGGDHVPSDINEQPAPEQPVAEPVVGDGTQGNRSDVDEQPAPEQPAAEPVVADGTQSNRSDVNEQLAPEQPAAEPVVADGTQGNRSPLAVSEQTPTEQTSPGRGASRSQVTVREAVAELVRVGEPVEHGASPSGGGGREVAVAQEEAEGPEGSTPSPRLCRVPAPEQGEPAKPQARTPQHTATPETAEPTGSHVRPLQETAMLTDTAPETTGTPRPTPAAELVVEPPASDESFATEEPLPKETDAGSEPKQTVEPMTAPADSRPVVLNAAGGGSSSGAGIEAKLDVLDSAAEQLREISEQVPPEPREPRANSGHVPETPREAAHGLPNAADREAVVASGEGEQPLLNALGTRQPATAPTAVPGADAVSSIESLAGADTAGGDGQQGDGPQHDLDASARNSTGPQADGTADEEVVDRLDSVFKQVLSTARLPVDLRQRIELARSIGRQVVRNAAVSVRNGQTHVLLQLRPPSLGTVRMHLTTENQTVSARMVVESEVVRQAVEQHVQHLRSVLRDQGLTLDRFEVSVRTQADADPWASAHPEGDGRGAGRAAGGDRLDAANQSGDAQGAGAEAVLASTHDGIVDYLA